MRQILRFSGIMFAEALLFLFVARYVFGSDSPTLILFPGLWAFSNGISIVSIMQFLIVTISFYLIAGFLLRLIYAGLQRILPGKSAFVVTTLGPLCFLAAIAYVERMNYNDFFHVGDTPQDCAQLEPSGRNWCYRSIYKRYPTKEVCAKLRGAEAEDCLSLCRATGDKDCQGTK